MADTKHHSSSLPVEGDGVDYKGIVWFLVILVGTIVACQVFVWGFFLFMESRAVASDAVRAPLAAEPAKPRIEGGRLVTGTEPPVATTAVARPGLLVDEPVALAAFRTEQDRALSTYGWANQGAGLVRLPINRAKELVLERGFPVRPAAAPVDAPAAAAAPAAR